MDAVVGDLARGPFPSTQVLAAAPLTLCTSVHTLDTVEFEWDPEKAESNRAKHGVDFAEAVDVLFDDLAVTIPDDDDDEERFVTLGSDALGRVVVVVYCWRGDRIRLISAREATRREERRYKERK
jgi:uncharacterized DUF497 family protein